MVSVHCEILTISFSQIYFSIAGVVCVIVVYRPIVIPPTIAIFVIFYCLRRYFLTSSRPVKRLEGITKSPMFSQLTSSLQGLTTIRAYKAEDLLINEFDRHQVPVVTESASYGILIH